MNSSDELLESYVSSEDSGGPRRKYYRITEAGRAYLGKLTDDWRKLYATVKNIGVAPE